MKIIKLKYNNTFNKKGQKMSKNVKKYNTIISIFLLSASLASASETISFKYNDKKEEMRVPFPDAYNLIGKYATSEKYKETIHTFNQDNEATIKIKKNSINVENAGSEAESIATDFSSIVGSNVVISKGYKTFDDYKKAHNYEELVIKKAKLDYYLEITDLCFGLDNGKCLSSIYKLYIGRNINDKQTFLYSPNGIEKHRYTKRWRTNLYDTKLSCDGIQVTDYYKIPLSNNDKAIYMLVDDVGEKSFNITSQDKMETKIFTDSGPMCPKATDIQI